MCQCRRCSRSSCGQATICGTRSPISWSQPGQRYTFVAACPVIFALMILMAVGRRASVTRPLGLAVAAALCVLGLEDKVQAILLIAALPLLVLPFGSAGSASVAFWRNTSLSRLAACSAAAVAIAAGWLAWPLIATGFDPALLAPADFHSLLMGRFGIYQAALLVLIGGCMIVYAMIWRVRGKACRTSAISASIWSDLTGVSKIGDIFAGMRCATSRQARIEAYDSGSCLLRVFT